MNSVEKKPRILMMGEEIAWEDLPSPAPADLTDYFRPVKLTPQSIDQASKLVPADVWIKEGLHSWLSRRADYVFSKLPSADTREGKFGVMKYRFEFDADGPVLKTVSI